MLELKALLKHRSIVASLAYDKQFFFLSCVLMLKLEENSNKKLCRLEGHKSKNADSDFSEMKAESSEAPDWSWPKKLT